MNPVLILFAHPALDKSRINARLIQEVRDLPGVTLNDLYETYPQGLIDVKREQELLDRHQVVVFHHPFYWYSSPAILKEWQDLVLEYGYAYGKGGTALKGKLMFNAVTTGGPRHAYREEGYNRFTMRQYLVPFDQTAHLCNMKYLAPFVIHGSLMISDYEDATPHALEYRSLIEALRDGTLDIAKAEAAERMNDVLADARAAKSPEAAAP
jgi:glutathione-regulated potassium-efflux system ancillary protein KefG